MSSIFQFMGGARATKSIVNAFSTSGWTPTAVSAPGSRLLLSGATTASTLKTLLTVAGAGSVSSLALSTTDPTTRTLRLRITVDGVVAFDSTSIAAGSGGVGCLVGAGLVGSSAALGEPIRFLTSLVVEVASSVTETDKLQLAYALQGV